MSLSFQERMEKGMSAAAPEMPVLPQETVQEPIEQSFEQLQSQELDEPQVQEQVEQPQETQQSKNFKFLREKNERLERENKEMQRLITQAQQQFNQPQITQQQPQKDYNLDPDDIVEGKHLSGVNNKIKQLEDQIKTYELKSKYPDLDKVLTNDNIEMFSKLYPELAGPLNYIPDVYNKAEAAYNMIKRLNINLDATFPTDAQKVITNNAKPKPLASVNSQRSDSPLTQANAFANGLTPELKAQLQREMNEARKSN